MELKPGMKVRFILKGPDTSGLGYVDSMRLIVENNNGVLTLGARAPGHRMVFFIKEDLSHFYKWHHSWFEPLEPEDKEKALVEKIQQLWERQPYVQQLKGLDISS